MVYYIVENSRFDDPKHIAPMKFIDILVHHRVVVIINCCQLYWITISTFMQQL